jgi:hypothetical protein
LKATGLTPEELLKATGLTPEELLKATGLTPEELLKATGLTPEELLKATGLTIEEATGLTLEVQPTVAFVGDDIYLKGVLTSDKGTLAGREVDILLNGSPYVTIKTDAHGYYQTVLQVPYGYIPKLELQALYYPRDKDIGLYLASLSPVIQVKVLYYEAKLAVKVGDKAYPGLETTLSGNFDYGQSPPLNERKVEVYLDNVLITEFIAPEAFSQKIKVAPDVDVGKHIITVSAVPAGRYAPVVASAVLNVTRATPILDLSMPRLAMIPGSVRLMGKLYSEVGPLSEASISIRLGKSQVEVVSDQNGAFDTKIGVGMGFGLIGSQDMVIQVLPQESWHAPLVTTKSLVIANMVNCGSILIILVFLSVYLPRRLERRLGVYFRRRARPTVAVARLEPTPAYSESVLIPVLAKEVGETYREPQDRIFYWYRFVVRVIQGITKVWPTPQQTLREFARESSGVLGAAAKYFIDFTGMVERLLYSQYKPTENDVVYSKQLSDDIEKETELRVTSQPLLAQQVHGEGTEAQFEPDRLSIVGRAGKFESSERVLTIGRWEQFSIWLWIVMVLALACYVCILILLLPLLVA